MASANVEIPPKRFAQAGVAAQSLGDMIWRRFPFVNGARATGSDLAELILNRTWRPALSVTGQSGLPNLGDAGNVLRPTTSLALSLRIPPTARAPEIVADLKKALTEDPPMAPGSLPSSTRRPRVGTPRLWRDGSKPRRRTPR